MSPSQQLSPATTRVLGTSHLERDKLHRWLARQPEPFRAGFWAAILLMDDKVTRWQLMSGGYIPPAERPEPVPTPIRSGGGRAALRPTHCVECGFALPPPKDTGRVRTLCAQCKNRADAKRKRERLARPVPALHLVETGETAKPEDEALAL